MTQIFVQMSEIMRISEHAQEPLCTVAFSNMPLKCDQWFSTNLRHLV